MSSYAIDTLNDVQRSAVIHTEGPCLIIAGPGSGKTRVLTHRVAYLIEEKGVAPHEVMVLTFTRKAANEMRTRLEKLLGEHVRGYWLGTFHSLFGRILRREAGVLGFEGNFSIYDTDDSRRLIKRLVKECNLDEDKYKPAVVLARIREAKRDRMDATAYGRDAQRQAEDAMRKLPEIARLYSYYQERCRGANAMDYDDLLLHTYRLFESEPDVLARYQERFRYVLVDEFQDTDAVQYGVLSALVREHRNFCVIGDDAQSIYAFRGADVGHILSFTKQYADAAVFKLEKNYRSTKHIVTVANALIGHNEQHKKVLVTDNPSGNPVRVVGLLNELEEARFVASSIHKQCGKGRAYDEAAVLFRNNSQSRALEEALLHRNIPYQVLGSMSFYQRKEIKDVLAYLYLVVNPMHEEALIRAINEPKRSVGAATLAKLRAYAHAEGTSLWEAVLSVGRWMKGGVAERIAAFAALIEEHQARRHEDAYTLASSLVKKSGLWHQLRCDTSAQGRNRSDNVEEFLQSIEHFCSSAQVDRSLAHFLEDIALLTSDEVGGQGDRATVKLMTMHKAKGLEFAYVYVVGMEEKLCPSMYASESLQGLQEDRRLFFVSITRAKKELTITYTQHRFLYGRVMDVQPSRFLNELDKGSVVFLEGSVRRQDKRSWAGSPRW